MAGKQECEQYLMPVVLKNLMPTPFSVSSALDFLRLGFETNFWGLACPVHCGTPSIATISLAFISGFGFGFGSGLILLLFLAFRLGLLSHSWGPFPASTPRAQQSSSPGLTRIQAYLYE